MKETYAKKNDCWHSIQTHEITEYTCSECGFVARNTREFRSHDCGRTDDDGERDTTTEANDTQDAPSPQADSRLGAFLNGAA
jgi:hypothetical protein